MKLKKTTIMLVAGIILGIAFTGISAVVLKKAGPLLIKAKKKLEERRIANIPKAKKVFILSDFENKNDLEKWDARSAKLDISSENATSGKKSLKMTFQPAQAPSVGIDKYFGKNAQLSDWSHYEVLSFDIYNPSDKQERIILQIKDTKGYKIKQDIQLRPKKVTTVEIDIRSLWENLKANKISQLNLFLWNNKNDKVFYLDNVVLLPNASMGKKGKGIMDSEFLPKAGEDVYKTGDYFKFDKSKWLKLNADMNISFIEVPLAISNYLPLNLPELNFTGGVPFGKGELKSLEGMELVDKSGSSLPHQVRSVSKWPDGSIKWTLFDLKTDVPSGRKKEMFLKYGNSIKPKKYNSKLTVKDRPGEIAVNTGALQFSVNKKKFLLFDSDFVLEHNGRKYHSSLDKNYELKIEDKGPLKVCLKAEGWFTDKRGEKFCKFIVRMFAYEGLSYVKVQHTFIYTGYPENKYHYLYKGKRLPKNETIESIYITTPAKITNDSTFTIGTEDNILKGHVPEEIDFYQDNYNTFKITENTKTVIRKGQLAGWIDLSDNAEGVSVGIENFWQQFPKKFSLNRKSQSIITYLWPPEAGLLDFKTTQAADGPGAVARGSAFGIAKTHDMIFNFHKENFIDANVERTMSALLSDIFVTPDPEWIAGTKVLGKVAAYNKQLAPGEDFMNNLFDWGTRQIENFHWYGMVDFGDTLSWYRKDAYDKSYDYWGWHPEGRWGWFNCEATGTHSGALIQFLRTGDYKYFTFGRNLARHIMDIDTCHYNTVANDKRLKGKIPDDYSHVGSMHRHNGNHWGGRNEEASHTNLYGLLLYYYMTGDPRAKDVIDEVGEFFLGEHITYYKHPDIAPQRTVANVLWGVVQLYELTGDERYKKAADKWAELFYKGQKGNGAWGENYNPVKKRWDGKPHLMFIEEYTIPALIAYHQLTGNKAIAGCIIEAIDFVIGAETYAAYFDGSAYCYWLTGNPEYSVNVKKRFDFTVGHQKKSDDPLWNGMIYNKAFYQRVSEYLYKVPFAFEVLTDK